MITDRILRILTSRAGKLLLVLIILAAVALQGVPYLVDTKPYVEQIAKSVHDMTGATLAVKGGSQLQMLPRPAIVLKNITLTQPGNAEAPTATADIAEVGFDIVSLAGGAPQVNALRMGGVVVSADKRDEKGAEWGFLGLPFLKALAQFAPNSPVAIELLGGRISVADVKAGRAHEVTNIDITGALGKATDLSGSLKFGEVPVKFHATRNGNIGSTPFAITVTGGTGNLLSLKGDMDFTGESPVVKGKIEAASPDLNPFFGVAPQEKPDAGATAAQPDTIPFKLSADYGQKEGLISLTNIALDTFNSKASGDWSWDFTQDNVQQQLDLNFSLLDIGGVRKLASFMLPKQSEDEHANKPLADKNLNLVIHVTADKMQNGAQTFGSTVFDGTVASGELTVNKLKLALPGDSQVSLLGLLLVSDTQGLRFEGNVETSGKSLRDALTVFDESAANLPALGFGPFNFRSNLFISSELLRLSEADAKFSELSLKGGMVAYFDKKPRLEADIGLSNINFDYFRDVWRANASSNDDSTTFLRFDKGMNFDWLKKLAATIDFTVNVNGFTFLERKGKDASLRLFAQAGEFGVYNAKFNYGTDVTEGNFKLGVMGVQPSVSLVLNTSALDTRYFMRDPKDGDPAPAPAMMAPAVAVTPASATPAAPATKPVITLAPDAPAAPAPAAAKPVPAPVTATKPVITLAPEKPAAATPAAPTLTPEQELKEKIKEEEKQLKAEEPATPAAAPAPEPKPAPITPAPITDVKPQDNMPATMAAPKDELLKEELKEEAPAPEEEKEDKGVWNQIQSFIIPSAHAQEAATPAAPVTPVADASAAAADTRWPDTLIDMSFMDGLDANFDISIGTLTHKGRVFQNFKMLTKLENSVITFQTLTFAYWGGSISINGTLYGGKVPGLSLGFIVASADIKQILQTLLGVDAIGGRTSISGTLETSGISWQSWVTQATAKMLFSGRGVTVRKFDIGSVPGAVSASRTAADVFNNVNLSIVSGTGEYSADGGINLQKGVVSTPGITLNTGQIVGSVAGDFKLLPWSINLSGAFKFPELAPDNVPSMTVQWAGPVEAPKLQTDTQALEALVSKRITGN